VHELAFGVKRAHLCALRKHKLLAERYKLTPARFDVLMVILRLGGTCLQRDVWMRLGLAPSTVSRMLDAMVAKDFVWKAPPTEGDKRQVAVGLTTSGLNRMEAAIEEFFMDYRLRSTWEVGHRGTFEERAAFIAATASAVRAVATNLGDDSDHRYRLEDFDEEDDARAYAFLDDVRENVERLDAARRANRPKAAPLTRVEPPPSDLDIFEATIDEICWWTKELTDAERREELEAYAWYLPVRARERL